MEGDPAFVRYRAVRSIGDAGSGHHYHNRLYRDKAYLSFLELRGSRCRIQPAIDNLVDTGVNKIILITHMQQIAIEKALAELLENVDIIVAGGSNTRMGESKDMLFSGDSAFAETYPYRTTSADGYPVLPSTLDDTLNGTWASTAGSGGGRFFVSPRSTEAFRLGCIIPSSPGILEIYRRCRHYSAAGYHQQPISEIISWKYSSLDLLACRSTFVPKGNHSSNCWNRPRSCFSRFARIGKVRAGLRPLFVRALS